MATPSVYAALIQKREEQQKPSPVVDQPIPFLLRAPQVAQVEQLPHEEEDDIPLPMPAPAPMPAPVVQKPSAGYQQQTPEDRDYEQAVKNRIEERMGGVRGMEEQIKALKAKEYGMDQLDLSPLMSLVDSWRGTHLAQDYKAPGQQAKDQATVEKLQEAINRERGGATDDMIQLLKDKAQTRQNADNARQHRFDESMAVRKEDNLRKDIYKVTDAYKEREGQMNAAEAAVRTGDTRTVLMHISSIARNIGDQKGALSDGDVARSMPTDVATNMAQLQAFLGSSATISPQLQVALLGLINRARANANAVATEAVARRKAAYASGSYADIMQPGSVGTRIFEEAERSFGPAQTAQSPGGKMSFEQWQASRKKGG